MNKVNLTGEGNGTHRHAKLFHGAVQSLQINALHHQGTHLHRERRQAAVHKETRHVLHEDRSLALAGTNLHRSRGHLKKTEKIHCVRGKYNK